MEYLNTEISFVTKTRYFFSSTHFLELQESSK